MSSVKVQRSAFIERRGWPQRLDWSLWLFLLFFFLHSVASNWSRKCFVFRPPSLRLKKKSSMAHDEIKVKVSVCQRWRMIWIYKLSLCSVLWRNSCAFTLCCFIIYLLSYSAVCQVVDGLDVQVQSWRRLKDPGGLPQSPTFLASTKLSTYRFTDIDHRQALIGRSEPSVLIHLWFTVCFYSK